MKCAKEIKAAAKVGGPNPDTNPRLKAAIDKALQNNLSRDSIQKNINGSNKDADKLKELTYEGYGPAGLAIIVKVLTDNENRAISALRGYFSKLKGNIAKPNSVTMLFDQLGQIIIEKSQINENDLLNLVLEFNIHDLKSDDELAFELLADPKDFYDIKTKLTENNIAIYDSEIKLIPNSTVDLTQEQYTLLERFEQQCEDDDDIQ